jgi:subtilisin-like proprotein convertase family protein
LSAGDLPQTISPTGTPTIVSRISYTNDLVISDVNVTLDLDHTFLSDLYISLTSPAGTTGALTANACGDLQNNNATFDDDGSTFSCSGDPALRGRVKPLGSLASFNGESTMGDWILEVMDTAPADGGELIEFTLELCVEGIFRPDDDEDGVFDDGDDLCLNTPPGTQVDTDGCPVFKFDPANFTLAIESEACRGNADGSILITAVQNLDYSVSVTGTGVTVAADFTSSYTLNDLADGTYTVCITGTDGTNDFEELCFEVVITQPDPLGVSALVSPDGTTVSLALTGAERYYVEWNGELLMVGGPGILLDSKNGNNTLKVTTDLPCQGTYEEQFFYSDKPIVYPNPFTEVTRIFLSRDLPRLQVTLHDASGRLIRQETVIVEGKEAAVDLTGMRSGLYYLILSGAEIKGTNKIIKK